MNTRRLLIASAFVVAGMAGTALARDPNVSTPSEPGGGGGRGFINVNVFDTETTLPISDAVGSLYTITYQGERPTLLSSSVTDRMGVLHLQTPSKKGDTFMLTVTAPTYQVTSQIVWIGSAPTTWTESGLFPIDASISGGKTPTGAPSSVNSTWGGIKSLF